MSTVDLTKLHCMVVEDDQSFRVLVESMLRKLGIGDVTCASGGAEALAILRNPPRAVDFIMCDFSMAGDNGLVLLRTIRMGEIRSTKPETCFIMVTGTAATSLVKSAVALDINGYLIKPFSVNALKSTILKAFQKHVAADPKRYGGISLPEDLA